jgi:hypothetical protein
MALLLVLPGAWVVVEELPTFVMAMPFTESSSDAILMALV